jgi:hypothetical protein
MLQAAKYIGSGLATIGLTKNILSPVLSGRLLCPSVISPTAKVAIRVVDDMLRNLNVDNPVLLHITNIALQSESLFGVTGHVEKGLLSPFSVIDFLDGDIPMNKVSKDAGVYVFTEQVVAPGETELRQAIGSAVDFSRRLGDHKHQFLGQSKPTSLHIIGNTLGGIAAFNWGSIYTLPNYLSLFYRAYPGYTLSQGEYNILMAVTQLVPRILEQSLFEHFKSELSGKDRLVKFTYTRFNVGSLTIPLIQGKTAKTIEILRDGKVILEAASQSQCAQLLGMGYKTVLSYLNHITPVNSPLLGLVNLQFSGYVGSLSTQPIVYREYPVFYFLTITGFEPDTLKPGILYAFIPPSTDGDFDFELYRTYTSMTKASVDLCPSNLTPRTMRNIIQWSTNMDNPVLTSAGLLFFAENTITDRFAANHEGVYPCYLHDLLLGTKTYFSGLRTVETHLSDFEFKTKTRIAKVSYDRLRTSYNTGKVIFNRFKVTPCKPII